MLKAGSWGRGQAQLRALPQPCPSPARHCSQAPLALSCQQGGHSCPPGRSLWCHHGAQGTHLQGQDVPCTDVDVDGVQGCWQEDPLPFAVDGGVLNRDKERKELAQGRGGPASARALKQPPAKAGEAQDPHTAPGGWRDAGMSTRSHSKAPCAVEEHPPLPGCTTSLPGSSR